MSSSAQTTCSNRPPTCSATRVHLRAPPSSTSSSETTSTTGRYRAKKGKANKGKKMRAPQTMTAKGRLLRRLPTPTPTRSSRLPRSQTFQQVGAPPEHGVQNQTQVCAAGKREEAAGERQEESRAKEEGEAPQEIRRRRLCRIKPRCRYTIHGCSATHPFATAACPFYPTTTRHVNTPISHAFSFFLQEYTQPI